MNKIKLYVQGMIWILLISCTNPTNMEINPEDLFLYSIDNGNAIITGLAENFSVTDLVIPETLDEYPVKVIDYGVFAHQSTLTSVSVPYSVTSILSSFYGCYSLIEINVDQSNMVYSSKSGVLFNKDKTILIQYPPAKTGDYEIPSSVLELTWDSFDGSQYLNSLILSSSLETIAGGAFNGSAITSINIPASVISIELDAFINCTFLSSITVDSENLYYSSGDDILFNKDKTILIKCPQKKSGNYSIPDSVSEIKYRAFISSEISYLYISESVNSISHQVFSISANLSIIEVDPLNVSFASEDGVLYDKNKTILYCYPMQKEDTSYIVPSSVTTIDGNSIGDAFDYNSFITTVTIPASVNEIKMYSFENCTSLSTVFLNSTTPPILGDRVFTNNASGRIFKVPSNLVDVYKADTNWLEYKYDIISQ